MFAIRIVVDMHHSSQVSTGRHGGLYCIGLSCVIPEGRIV